ncbi:sensor histidine kinase [Hydrogenophaga pseudoflava]|uniref:histidine kinase n=1 Tax=Hydrogenophaga pseudoflava TaxID=47421 RepID=A0A4P6X5M7_HYDPS|nr:HAMP domain-containing sensor histidine kinase [Hydrogenophaga pseudoflava]QBM29044.1 Sensor protein QseC [Hydrogenophaga pseudoflava]
MTGPASTPSAPAARPWSITVRLLLGLALCLLLVELLLQAFIPELAAAPLWGGVLRLVAVLPLFAWCAGRALAPLRLLEDELHAGEAGSAPRPVPAELQPLSDAVHGVLAHQRAATEQQRRFLADASHQLRTPFAVLRTQLQGAMSGQLEVKDTLPKMLATVDRSSELVRQLLSLAKVEQLVAQAHWQEVDLDTVAQAVCLEFGPLLARKRLDFSFESVPVRLTTDPWMLGELLRNLLSNAIHHAPRGSALGMVVRVLPDQAELLIWDNGGGIDAAVMDRLFEPFQSAAGGTGIGLGLSICRQIAESMQAQVQLFNRVQDDRVVGVDAVVRWNLAPAGAGGLHA